MAKKVVVTGGTGLLGLWIVKEFLASGYEVVNADIRRSEEPGVRTVVTDLENLGEVYGVLQGADAVVHLAAIPQAYTHSNERTFRNNVMTTYNVLEAAAGLGIRKAVIASSESSYGLVFPLKRLEPMYVPMDEAHPQYPEDSYGLSKIVNEQTADLFHRRTGMQVVSFRLGNVITPTTYANFPSFIHKPEEREVILWSYIDARDAGVACRLAVEAEGLGSVALNLANDETSMDIPTRELLAARYPGVTDIRTPLEGYETLLDSSKAKRLLGWQPQHRWRDYVKV
ncbi:NAD(P)-dependent oxidoreductase [Paenibacillus sp. TRM 82003]|nr:NAD(P)-dependent oxidoreductase [Paenibacillus sp. TRM 82003]